MQLLVHCIASPLVCVCGDFLGYIILYDVSTLNSTMHLLLNDGLVGSVLANSCICQ